MNWGLIGYGRIAPKFANSLVAANQEIVGIASQSNLSAIQKDYPNAIAYDSYEELLANPDIDIVYISTTHNFHVQNTLDSLEAGKHVLCEKPLGLCKSEVEIMVDRAKSKNRFLMEGMWTRFLPAYVKMREIIDRGVIGDIRIIEANFGFAGYADPKERLFDKLLAGGSVYDVGIYPIALFLDIYGEQAIEIKKQMQMSDAGIDLTCNAQLAFETGRLGNMISSIVMQTSHDACIYGTKGWIKLPCFWRSQEIELNIHYTEGQVIELPFVSTGYYHEILEVVDCIENNKIESSVMSYQHSIDISNTIDRILKVS